MLLSPEAGAGILPLVFCRLPLVSMLFFKMKTNQAFGWKT
jgi:hypothetical protein